MYIKKKDLINLADRLESIQNQITDRDCESAGRDAEYLESVVDLWIQGIYEEVEP